MKFYLLLLFAFLTVCYSAAQDTTFYNAKNEKVKTKKKAAYSRVITYSNDSSVATIADFFPNGNLKTKRVIKKRSANHIIETVANYFENGKPKFFYTMANAKLEGNFLFYNEDGKMSMIFQYENGEIKQKKFFDKEGVEFPKPDENVYLMTEVMPEFPGGTKAFMLYLAANVKYPKESLEWGASGRVVINFIINKKGEVSEVELVNGVDFYINNAALLAVKNMPRWSPGMLNGEPASVKFTVPIKFGVAPE